MTNTKTDAKRKEQALDRANLGQDEAAEERRGKEQMEHMEGDAPRRDRASSPRDKGETARAPKR